MADFTPRHEVFSDEERSDLTTWAHQTGNDLAWALQAFNGQQAFNKHVTSLEIQFPDDFAYAEWVPSARPYGIVLFKGKPGPEILEAASAISLNVVVRGGMEHSAAEFSAILAREYFSAVDRVGVEDVVATAYPGRSVIVLTAPEHAANVLRESSPETPSSLGVNVIVESALAGTQPSVEGILGGRAWGACTAGFSVVRGSVYGMSTANHCTSVGGTTSYQGASMALPSAPAALDPNSGDAKWRRVVGDVAEPRFQSAPNAYRLVTGTANPAVGTAICKYGVSTGQTCDTVVAVNTCANGYCGLSKVGNDISEPGDSGGPWFFGNTAMGIHHGTAYHGLKLVSAFTRIGAVNLLSVAVVTG